eukprot:CAMPEP_0119416386 /NCGR_PEP_ID=MMETSP1335-20130426/12831_1 /TAXON_ID=259385 /ORGANISM="Chrysoculter rhomboideus, Strain RCC1486" /LENGTH=124 /DNA_ID=CAMNT_0007441507 /DNA_START=443 /DNA_END=817 /DNA_ORIENTATION=-
MLNAKQMADFVHEHHAAPSKEVRIGRCAVTVARERENARAVARRCLAEHKVPLRSLLGEVVPSDGEREESVRAHRARKVSMHSLGGYLRTVACLPPAACSQRSFRRQGSADPARKAVVRAHTLG